MRTQPSGRPARRRTTRPRQAAARLRRFSVVVTEHPAESLVIPLSVVMSDVLANCASQGVFAKEDHPAVSGLGTTPQDGRPVGLRR